MRYRSLLFIMLFIVTACGRRTTPTPGISIDQAIATALASQPTAVPSRISAPNPTPTPSDLRGLFCEYQFCIGHPVDMAFYDVSVVTSNQGTPSNYQTGLMAAYSGGLVLQVVWQFSPGTADPSFLLNLIIDDRLDTPVGTQSVKLIRDMNVVYTALTTTATPVLPFGGAAAWTCGDRVFAWKAYTADEASPPGLFDSALARFVCQR